VKRCGEGAANVLRAVRVNGVVRVVRVVETGFGCVWWVAVRVIFILSVFLPVAV